jgi:uncharacterized protein (TIGR02186 family)
MQRATCFIIVMVMLYATNAVAKPFISDLSDNDIKIDAGFVGTELFLFGARNEAGDLVAVVRGPKQSYIVRKKEKVAGIWLNRKQINFTDIYSFYSFASSVSLGEIEGNNLREILNIGIDNIPLSYSGEANFSDLADFRQALLDNKFNNGLYVKDIGVIDFMGDTLFKTTLKFPKKMLKGTYTAEIYLINNGELVGVQSTPIIADKVGIQAYIYNLAHEHSALYGLIAIALALFAGWLASAIFWKI